jgi:hypothetical protein
MNEPQPPPSAGDPAAAAMPFGPYAGQPVTAVAVMDPDYLLEVVREGVGPADLRAAAAAALAQRGRLVAARTRGVPASGTPQRSAAALFAVTGLLALALALGARARNPAGPSGDADAPVPPATLAGAPTAPPRPATPPSRTAGAAVTAAAAGGAAATPPAGSPAPCGARTAGALPAAAAADYLDTFQAIEFFVVRTKDTGRVTFLNSHEPYQGHFYVAIFPSEYGQFPTPPVQHFRDRCVIVQGTIELYRGAPQIVLRSADDIRILEP